MTDLKITSSRFILFIGSFSQVMFVAMNVYFIGKGLVIPMIITSFFVSLIWTLNVKHISIGSMVDRVYYATGAMLGTMVGYYFSHYIANLL